MFHVSLADDSAKATSRYMRAFSDALAAWGAVAAHNASIAPLATGGLTPGAAKSHDDATPAQWAADAVARVLDAQRATMTAQTEAWRAATSWRGAELASNPFGITGFFTSAAPAGDAKQAAAKPPAANTAKPKTAAKAKAATAPKRSAFLKRPVGQPDDLTQIKGVGPKLAESLREAGIHHFWQLASLTDEDVELVNSRLKLSGRIERDGWIDQARDMMGPTKG